MGQLQGYKSEWIKYWKQNKLDFIIAPGFGCQALKHGLSQHTALTAAYTFVWNLLDMPALSMPITRVRADEQVYESAHKDLLTTNLVENCKDSEGLPVGIQVIGLPYTEQKILGFSYQLEQKIKFYENNPLPKI